MTDAVTRLRAAVDALPRRQLGIFPTPLTRMSFEDDLQIWVKRDDLTGPGMSGNKIRKLEFLLGDALARGADCVLTVGAAQSNHARLTAAAGATVGLPTHLVLGGEPPTTGQGNQLLAGLFGAQIHFPGTDDWNELEQAQDELADRLRENGQHPYTMPIGGSTPIGAVGFAAAYDEILQQCAQMNIRPAAVLHATSSGGTHAGLLAGEACYRHDGHRTPELVAISVAKMDSDLKNHAVTLARSSLELLDVPAAVIDESSVEVDGRWRGADYARPTPAGDRAIIRAARSNALVLDRVYTGKAFAGLLGHIAEHRWAPGSAIVFWHTGGQPALFAPDGCPPTEPSSSPTPDAPVVTRPRARDHTRRVS